MLYYKNIWTLSQIIFFFKSPLIILTNVCRRTDLNLEECLSLSIGLPLHLVKSAEPETGALMKRGSSHEKCTHSDESLEDEHGLFYTIADL